MSLTCGRMIFEIEMLKIIHHQIKQVCNKLLAGEHVVLCSLAQNYKSANIVNKLQYLYFTVYKIVFRQLKKSPASFIKNMLYFSYAHTGDLFLLFDVAEVNKPSKQDIYSFTQRNVWSIIATFTQPVYGG